MRHRASFTHRRRNLYVVLLASLAAGMAGCTSGSGGGKASVPALLDPPTEEVVAYIAIPSLDLALQHVCELGTRIAPPGTPAPTPETLKAQLGTMLGDPKLAALDSSRPIVVAVLKPSPSQPGPIPPIVALVPAKDAAKLAEQVAPLGIVGKATDGMVALAQTPQALELAAKVKPLYDRFADTKITATGRIYADADALLAAYGTLIELGLSQITRSFSAMQQPPGATRPPANMAKMIKLEARIALALLAQVDALQVDLELGRDWIGAHAASRAKAGSELASVFERSAVLKAPTQSVLENQKGMLMSAALDAGSVVALYRKLLEVLAADPDTKDFASPEIMDMVSKFQGFWDGTMTMSMGVGDSGMAMGYEMGVASEEKLVAMMESTSKLLAPGGSLASMYKDMGMEIKASFQKSARTHAGSSIHGFKIDGELSKDADPALLTNAKQLKPLLVQNFEFAVTANRGLGSSSPAELDRMIDAALAKKPGTNLALKAREVFGEGRQAYVDYDLASILGFAKAGIPAGEVRESFERMASSLAGVPPMVAAFTAEGSRGLLQLRFPVDFMAKIGEASRQPR